MVFDYSKYEVKRFLLSEYPIPSQVVLAGTISRGKNLRSIVSKILIQMNAKLGGIPWAVDKLPFMDKPTMICGMDVFHATCLGKRSVLGLTASMNNSATTYWSTSVLQDDVGQEASNNLCKGMRGAVEAFKRANGTYPAQIIFYRDGVGEGQVEGVCRAEINQIKQFQPTDATTNPSLILKAAQLPEYATLVNSSVEYAKVNSSGGDEAALLALTVDRLCANNSGVDRWLGPLARRKFSRC